MSVFFHRGVGLNEVWRADPTCKLTPRKCYRINKKRIGNEEFASPSGLFPIVIPGILVFSISSETISSSSRKFAACNPKTFHRHTWILMWRDLYYNLPKIRHGTLGDTLRQPSEPLQNVAATPWNARQRSSETSCANPRKLGTKGKIAKIRLKG